MKGRRNTIINMYHCKNCDLKFLTPMKLTHGKRHTEFVCPECKSHDWGHIW
jgi:predicted SprT family Zn-dependent metalloprotease